MKRYWCKDCGWRKPRGQKQSYCPLCHAKHEKWRRTLKRILTRSKAIPRT